MTAVADSNDVGSILVKVQDELQRLKEQLTSSSTPDASTTSILDLRGLESAINRTEKGIKVHAEEVLHAANNQVLTLPLLNQNARARGDVKDANASNVHLTSRLPRAVHTRHVIGGGLNLSPGQKVRQAWGGKLLGNPTNPVARDFLRESYGVALPAVGAKRDVQAPTKRIVVGTTVEPLTVLPKQNRVDAQLTPPPITEEDARKGIRSLIERGLIPPAAELSLDPSPVKNKPALIHSPLAQHARHTISDGTAAGANLALVKMDPERASSSYHSKTPESQLRSRQRSESPLIREASSVYWQTKPSSGASTATKSTRLLTPVTFDTPLQPQAPQPTPATGLNIVQKLVIQQGVTVTSTPDYRAYKQSNALQWGSIVTILKQLEELLKAYSIPLAFIDGDKLVDLSMEYELEQHPSREELLNCIINNKDIGKLMSMPGRRFRGHDGHHIAATTIQAQFRMYRERALYRAHRKQKWAVGIIAVMWVMQMKMRNLRHTLKLKRVAQLERFRQRAREFRHNWHDICKSRRVVVHIPSRAYPENIRDRMNHFHLTENLQIGRLCDIRDSLVDVVYVSPVELNDEMSQYYVKLMGMCEESQLDGQQEGKVANEEPIETRFHFVVPDNLNTFKGHNMSLATLLMYSPIAIQRIKNLIAGKHAFIVSGLQSKHDDVAVADMLDLPCLSSEPDVALSYATKSGGRRIFISSQAARPPCEFDIYSEHQLITSLSKLVANNLDIKRWLFKIDDEFDSRGIAYCDIVDNLPCRDWVVKQRGHFGDSWSNKWAQERAVSQIAADLPAILESHTVIVKKQIYPNWKSFLEVFKRGGVIEAAPACDNNNVTSITVDLVIDPVGEIKLLSTGDQIHDSPYHCYGLSIPQSSVDPNQLQTASVDIAMAACRRGLLGYMTIDFVTFIDSQTMCQELWAVDLGVGYSDSLAMSRVFGYVTGGRFDFSEGLFEVPIERRMREYEMHEQQRREEHREWDEELIPMKPPCPVRFAVMSSRLVHTNLSVIQYNVFFRMCKAHSVGFDMQEKTGAVFTLVDSTIRSHLGMICIAEDLQAALQMFSRNLSVIHQEISSPDMPGRNNFKTVAIEMDKILGITEENKAVEAQHKDTPN
ncbi:IQ domain-containing protein H-like isoform X2 [Corticium candelabrum]|uniref:IQ domain-containing protein H-like isoform X2 n=1 Tax=Corticium candelabrum TaxID=121492 RepID=UPI002E25478E|nr:IQ domain-containing protein H-like isoform X2 [Corticium candelabrum]